MKRENNNFRGRFAPSPTGLMHVGNARTALMAWLSIRSKGGRFVWRLEDLDTPRVVSGMAEAAEKDLNWLGLDWDEGPKQGGAYGPYDQSSRFSLYEEALSQLLEAERIFPCTYSRKDLQALASAPHGAGPGSPYPVSLRPVSLEAGWFEKLNESNSPYASIRFKVQPGTVAFVDKVQGKIEQEVLQEVGDFVVKRRDGMYAYQLAVVVDDIAMRISEVVRGVDLVSSTPRQIQLVRALAGSIPDYAHVPLVLNDKGEKLSKRDQGLTLASLREAGVQPEQLVGYFAFSLGLIDELISLSAGALIDHFRWEKIRKIDWVMPADITRILLEI